MPKPLEMASGITCYKQKIGRRLRPQNKRHSVIHDSPSERVRSVVVVITAVAVAVADAGVPEQGLRFS